VIGHYRVVLKIGEGGMGGVYLAQDTRLDRKVALKILPAEVAANRGRMERFVREAKSAAALSHPNIITIHEIEQIDSVNFIAMEFIDGVTLREHMRNSARCSMSPRRSRMRFRLLMRRTSSIATSSLRTS
jgi:serine/threonine protein kinase